MHYSGCCLQQIFAKSIIRRIYIEELQMQNTSKGFQPSKHRIHQSNLVLHKEMLGPGLVGPRHSELINRLIRKTTDLKEQKSKQTAPFEPISQDAKALKQKIDDLERESLNLKREMIRISELSKNNKNSKIAFEIKYESLLCEFNKKQSYIQQLQQKVKVGTELNNCLLKITENVLCVLPHYQNNCQSLQSYITIVKSKLENKAEFKVPGMQEIGTVLDDLYQRLDAFKTEVEDMQAYQKKMMINLADTHLETKSISERLSIISNLNLDEIINFKQQISNINVLLQPQIHSDDSQDDIAVQRHLSVSSDVCPFTFFPEKGPRINKIFSEVSMLFQQHIHLLQNQKMEYQFTKNKKLIACQKFDCEICESYQKIVSQTFSIVRQAFKEIKFQFLREIKQISDASQIPLLI